jgi:hypothetical protein
MGCVAEPPQSLGQLKMCRPLAMLRYWKRGRLEWRRPIAPKARRLAEPAEKLKVAPYRASSPITGRIARQVGEARRTATDCAFAWGLFHNSSMSRSRA